MKTRGGNFFFRAKKKYPYDEEFDRYLFNINLYCLSTAVETPHYIINGTFDWHKHNDFARPGSSSPWFATNLGGNN